MNDVTIIGTGPAGLTAAIYTTRGGLKTQVYAGIQHGCSVPPNELQLIGCYSHQSGSI